MSRPIRRSRRIECIVRQNDRFARRLWPSAVKPSDLVALAELTRQAGLSLASGEVLWLDGKWYVTSPGLLRLAKDNRCCGIRTDIISEFSDRNASRWVFKATVYKTSRSKGFVGYGDADPSNTSPLVRGAEMRVAETRAVNRALRKAYGIGLCSLEELRSFSSSSSFPLRQEKNGKRPQGSNGSAQPPARLRDQLCLLIRQHQLDPALVKRYAADFCGTQELREASRDLVESFIAHLAESAAKNRDGLVCKLNSYAQAQEVRP
jgi:hypothetical protein